MNAEANSSLNTAKWVVVVMLVAAGVYGNSYFAGESLLYRVLGLLALALVQALTAPLAAHFAAAHPLACWPQCYHRRVSALPEQHQRACCLPPASLNLSLQLHEPVCPVRVHPMLVLVRLTHLIAVSARYRCRGYSIAGLELPRFEAG